MKIDAHDDLGGYQPTNTVDTSNPPRQVKEVKTPYDLELHEEMYDDYGGQVRSWRITRVPGGWIYRSTSTNPIAVFVPHYEEPQEAQVGENEKAFVESIVDCLNGYLNGEGSSTDANRIIRTLMRPVKTTE